MDILGALRDPEFRRGFRQGILDAANRGIAATLGAPVDIATMVARPFGYSTPDRQVVGSSEWLGKQMEDLGMVSTARNPVAEMLASVIMPAGVTTQGRRLYELEQAAARNLATPRTLNTPGYGGQRGAIVYHGSPHKFEAFDASKIGTGEGAQAYGHGMYFAESPDVAKGYRDLLTKSDKQFYIKGKRVEPELLDSFQSNVLNAKGYGRNKQDYLDELEMNRVSSGAIQKISKIWDEMGDVSVKEVLPENASLYKVDLPDEAIAKMLDWDKPLSQQSKEVQKAIKKSQFYKDALTRYKETKQWYDEPKQKTGQSLLQYMQSGIGDEVGKGITPEAASAYLRAQGIPGIRYLDQSSRGAGAGTSNFVVFPGEERLLKILERNNQPMASKK